MQDTLESYLFDLPKLGTEPMLDVKTVVLFVFVQTPEPPIVLDQELVECHYGPYEACGVWTHRSDRLVGLESKLNKKITA